MAAVTRARKASWLRSSPRSRLDLEHQLADAVHEKEICGQCLQRHVNPQTGEPNTYVFSCFNQDQASDCVDWKNLNDRLRMNSVEEKIANLWLDHILAKEPVPAV
jgi:hypothetical protein